MTTDQKVVVKVFVSDELKLVILVEDNERSGQPKKFEDNEMQVIGLK